MHPSADAPRHQQPRRGALDRRRAAGPALPPPQPGHAADPGHHRGERHRYRRAGSLRRPHHRDPRAPDAPGHVRRAALRARRSQQHTGSGPCLTAAASQQLVCIDDTHDEQRWPEFTARAVELGVRSVICVPLWVSEDVLGTLSLYSQQDRVFGPYVQVTELVAAHAALALATATLVQQLRSAFSTATSSARPKAYSWSATASPPMTPSHGCPPLAGHQPQAVRDLRFAH